MKKVILTLIVSLTSLPSFSESSFSGEVTIGSANQKVQESLIESGDSSSYGLRVSYEFNKYLSALIEYKNFGEAENKYKEPFEPLIWNIETRSINFGIRGTLPLTQDLSVVGEVGYSDWDMDINARLNELSDTFTNDGSDLYYRAGINYKFNEKYKLGIEYSILEVELPNGEHKISDVSMSVGMRF